MESGVLEKFWDARNRFSDSWDAVTVFVTLVVLVVASFALVVLRHAVRRQSYYNKIPMKQTRFIDFLGNWRDFPYWNLGYRGLTFNVFFLQVLAGFLHLYRNEKLVLVWLSYIPFVLVAKAEVVEATISGTKMMQKNWSYKWLQPWLGTGLLTSHGSKWKSRRKLMTPSFHFDILKDFLPIFNEQSQVLVRCLQPELKKDFTDIVMPVTLCSLDIICETTLGVSIGAQENSESQYVKSVIRAGDLIMERMATIWYWFDITYRLTKSGRELSQHLKILHTFTRMVIHEKKKKLLCGEEEVGNRKRKALMDLLLEHHVQTKQLTEEDIREEIDTFAFEGHDTTSMGISWALYLIGSHPRVQEKLHEEMDRIFGRDLERPAAMEDIKDMEYLDRVLKESQRLFPSVPMISRHVENETNLCGYTIPKGSSVLILTYALHRDEKVFPDPEKFDPDRFLPENSKDRHPFAYIPFSAGPRNCIGQRFALLEEKVVVSTLLRHFRLESLDPRDRLHPAPELILRCHNPIRIKIRPRNP